MLLLFQHYKDASAVRNVATDVVKSAVLHGASLFLFLHIKQMSQIVRDQKKLRLAQKDPSLCFCIDRYVTICLDMKVLVMF